MRRQTSECSVHSVSNKVLLEREPLDLFQEAGIDLPSHLNTKTRRWASLVLIAVSGAFASGPFASWPTLEPLLIREGVWAGPNQQANLTSVYSISAGVAMISVLIAGIFYDALGPRAVGAGGAFGVCFALIGMALAIEIPSLNYMLWIAYPVANILGCANTMDAYAWLWLLPDDRSTVAAVAGAIQCLSDSFCLFAVFLHDHYGFRLPYYFVLSAFLSMVAGFLALAFVPSREEMQKISRAVISYQAVVEASGEGYGSTDHAQRDITSTESEDSPKNDTFCDVLSKSSSALKDACTLYGKVHPGISFLFFCYMMAQYLFTMYPMFQMYPLYKDMMGPAKATSLVNIFGGLYACIGAVSLLLFGKIVDKLGMFQANAWLNVCTLLNAYLYSVPTVASQVTAQAFLAFNANVWYVLWPAFCVIYGPPELFGSMYGLFTAIVGIGQIVLTRLATLACKAITEYLTHGHGQPSLVLLTTIDLWGFFTVWGSFSVLLWWWYRPLPQPGSTTMAHVRAASCGSDRVGEPIVGLNGKDRV